MIRRLFYLTVVAGLLGVFLPTNPVTASDDPDDYAAAAITGEVALTETQCTVVNGQPGDKKPGNQTDGHIAVFSQLLLAGVFADVGALNVPYVGQVNATGPIEACSSRILANPPAPVPPLCPKKDPPGSPRRECDLLTWGDIRDPATPVDFEGGPTLGKCLDGELGDFPNAQGGPRYGPDGQVGDFVTAGLVAFVKFDIGYELQDVNPITGACEPKATVNEIDCIGVIGVVPLVVVGAPNQIGGEIKCHNALPSNFGNKK